MAEWSIAAVLKTVEPRGSRGSNPCLSAESTEQNKRVSGQKPTNLRFVGFFIIAYKSCLQCLIRRKFGSPDKPGGLSIQLCKSEKKEFYIRYSS